MGNNKALKINKDKTLQFLFLFHNADGFYISARYAINYGWIGPGCSNAQQAIELYIKAILKLNNEESKKEHNLLSLLRKYEDREKYFSDLLKNDNLCDFLKELSDAYLILRYGEAGSNSNASKIIQILDELSYNLRNIYLTNIRSPSKKIYIPLEARSDFLNNNNFFTEKDLTSNPLAQMGLPIDDFTDKLPKQ